MVYRRHDDGTAPFVANRSEQPEEGLDIPWERLAQDTLINMVAEFVTREWSDLGDSCFTMDDKIDQVIQQLKAKKVKVVFDFATGTGNIVVCR